MYFKTSVLTLFGLAVFASITSNHATGMKMKWGILGAGKISWDFIKSLKNFDTSKHEVVAIASQNNHDRAQHYAKELNIPTVYQTYEELLKDNNVNVVYIATLNPYHFQAVRMALLANKPVLCEKPLVLHPQEARELFDLAKKQGVFFMEAMWSRFIPAYQRLDQLIKEGAIGKLEFAQANFLLPLAQIPRIREYELGGGVTLDVGIYALNAVLSGVNYEKPIEIKAVGTKFDQGPDQSMTAVLRWANGVTANIAVAANISESAAPHVNHVLYAGSHGYIKLPMPINSPTSIEVNGQTEQIDFRDIQTDYNWPNDSGLRFEAEEVRRCLTEGKLYSQRMSPENSILLADLISSIHEQLGVKHEPSDRTQEFKHIPK